jgi:replicative DNA helicase
MNDTPRDEQTPRLIRPADLLGEWEADAEARAEAVRNQHPLGPVTGFERFDRALGGCLAPGVHVLHAGPGAGKTALALQIAATCGFPALFVTAEMSCLELLRRLAARTTSTFLGRFKTGELPPADSLRLAREAIEAAPLLCFADATRAPALPAWIEQAAEIARGNSPQLLVAIDSVHSWAEGLQGEAAEYDVVNAAVAALRTLGGRFTSPVLAIAERNRASMAKGGMNAAAASRKFEYSAESVLELERDMDKPADAAGEVPVTLRISKNRNGAVAKVELRFHGALQRFSEANPPKDGPTISVHGRKPGGK